MVGGGIGAAFAIANSVAGSNWATPATGAAVLLPLGAVLLRSKTAGSWKWLPSLLSGACGAGLVLFGFVAPDQFPLVFALLTVVGGAGVCVAEFIDYAPAKSTADPAPKSPVSG